MTIQLDGRTEIPLHPLDLTYFPPNDANSEMCIGAIQTPSQFPGLVLTATDMILGVPFLRSTYTVMAFDQPSSDGSFPPNSADVNRVESVRPRLGLLHLNYPAVAADEFDQVRSVGIGAGIPAGIWPETRTRTRGRPGPVRTGTGYGRLNAGPGRVRVSTRVCYTLCSHCAFFVSVHAHPDTLVFSPLN